MGRYVNFFDGIRPELVQAYESKTPRDLNILLGKLRPKLFGYASKLIYMYNPVDADDLIQEALLKAVKYIYDYRYICPVCQEKYDNGISYYAHTKGNYGKKIKPVRGIDYWVSYAIRQSMLNTRTVIKRNASREIFCGLVNCDKGANRGMDRKGVEGLIMAEKLDFKTPESEFIFYELVYQLKNKCAEQENSKLRFFMERALSFEDPVSIFEEMAETGLSKTSYSAQETIRYHFKANPLLKKYKEMLLAG
jgi:hypothetical protein